MPQLKIPSADSALKPLVGQFIVTTHDCAIIVSRAWDFTRNRGLRLSPILAVEARDGVEGIGRDYHHQNFVRQQADVLAACPTFIEAVTAAYTFFESGKEAPAA